MSSYSECTFLFCRPPLRGPALKFVVAAEEGRSTVGSCEITSHDTLESYHPWHLADRSYSISDRPPVGPREVGHRLFGNRFLVGGKDDEGIEKGTVGLFVRRGRWRRLGAAGHAERQRRLGL